MRRALLICLLLLSAPAGLAADTPASPASVHELLEAMHARRTLDSVMTMMYGSMKAGMQAAIGERQLPANQQKIVDEMRAKIVAIMTDELSWEQMEPLYVDIYTTSFTQQEVDGLLAFYRSPVGIAYVAKLPGVMQLTTQKMQARLGPMVAKLQQQQRDMIAQMVSELQKAEDAH